MTIFYMKSLDIFFFRLFFSLRWQLIILVMNLLFIFICLDSFKFFFNLFFLFFVGCSAAIIDNKRFAIGSNITQEIFDLIFCIPKDFIDFGFIENNVLIIICTAMACIVDEQEDFEVEIVSKTFRYKIWFLFFCFNVSLQKNLFVTVQWYFDFVGLYGLFHNKLFYVIPSHITNLGLI